MKKSFLPFLGFWMLTAMSLPAQMEEFDFFPPSKMQTHRVLSITATTYPLSDSAGKTKAGKAAAEEEYFLNEEGWITAHNYLPGYDYLPKTIEIRYDGMGRRTHIFETTKDQEGKKLLMLSTMYAYNANMKPAAVYRYFARDSGLSKLDVMFVYEFDDNNRISAEKIMASPTVVKSRRIFHYAADGTETQMWVTEEDSSLCKKVFPDENGRISRTETPAPPNNNQKEKGTLEVTCRYDELGLLREQKTVWKQDGFPVFRPLMLDTYQYDVYGVLQEKIEWQFDGEVKDFVPFSVVKYTYETTAKKPAGDAGTQK